MKTRETISLVIYAVGDLFKVPLLDKIPWQTVTSNFISNSVFGLVLAGLMRRLLPETTWRRSGWTLNFSRN